MTKLTHIKRNVILSAVTLAYEVADGVTAGLGWGLALCAGASAADAGYVPELLPQLRREGNVIYLPARAGSK